MHTPQPLGYRRVDPEHINTAEAADMFMPQDEMPHFVHVTFPPWAHKPQCNCLPSHTHRQTRTHTDTCVADEVIWVPTGGDGKACKAVCVKQLVCGGISKKNTNRSSSLSFFLLLCAIPCKATSYWLHEKSSYWWGQTVVLSSSFIILPQFFNIKLSQALSRWATLHHFFN